MYILALAAMSGIMSTALFSGNRKDHGHSVVGIMEATILDRKERIRLKG